MLHMPPYYFCKAGARFMREREYFFFFCRLERAMPSIRLPARAMIRGVDS